MGGLTHEKENGKGNEGVCLDGRGCGGHYADLLFQTSDVGVK